MQEVGHLHHLLSEGVGGLPEEVAASWAAGEWVWEGRRRRHRPPTSSLRHPATAYGEEPCPLRQEWVGLQDARYGIEFRGMSERFVQGCFFLISNPQHFLPVAPFSLNTLYFDPSVETTHRHSF